jgi:hypothetical protein
MGEKRNIVPLLREPRWFRGTEGKSGRSQRVETVKARVGRKVEDGGERLYHGRLLGKFGE